MSQLADPEKQELLALIEAGHPLPETWRHRLFPASPWAVEISQEYRLEYQGKIKREAVLAETPGEPVTLWWQSGDEISREHAP